MSFSLFNSGLAQAYGNSFRPWRPNGGFENVKSDMAKKYMSAIPAANFKAGMDMARAGLDNYTGLLKTEMANDALKERLEMTIEANKKAALRNMLGRSLGSRAGGSSGGGVSLAGDAGLLGLIPGGAVGDPLSDSVRDLSNVRTLQGLVGQKSPAYAAPAAALRQATENINSVGIGGGGALQVPEVGVPKPQVAPAPSTQLSDEKAQEIEAFTLKAVEGLIQGGESK